MKKLVATAPRVAALVEYEDRAILANEVKIRVRFGAPKHGTEVVDFRAASPFIDEDFNGEWQMFTKIVLPQVLPGLTAVGILSFMTSWNEYLYGVIFVQDPQNFTIPLLLSTMNSEQELTQWGMVASGGVISLIPVLFFVIFAQNFLISGLSSGAVKE